MNPANVSSVAGSSQQPAVSGSGRRRNFLRFLCCAKPATAAPPRLPSATLPPVEGQSRLGQLSLQDLSAEQPYLSGVQMKQMIRPPDALPVSLSIPGPSQPLVKGLDRFSIRLENAKHLLQEQFDHFKAKIENSIDIESERSKELEHLADLKQRFDTQIERLATNLEELYGNRHDLNDILKPMVQKLITIGLERPEELRELDKKRENDPNWFCSNKAVEATIYVENHCGRLSELAKEIDLFKLLRINILHLMPTIYKTPAGENDGGYAISDYRSLNPEIGTMEEMSDVFAKLRKSGISPALDITINHTSNEHQWAREAMAGDAEKQDYYYLMDEAEKDQYQRHLKDYFPSIRKGSFTWNNELEKFVWTTFKSCQWDLNYSNPKVLMAMAEEMLFLANKGAEVLRLDSVPLIGKKKGTDCLNQGEILPILRVFNAMTKIVAPAVIYKSEAIVPPREAKNYLSPDKCQIAYNPMLMHLMWDALCYQNAKLLARTLTNLGQTPEGSAWVNYIRCHDDIGYNYDRESAQELEIDIDQRQRMMNDFYFGKTEGSYAKGLAFQTEAETGKARIAGTLGSLTGVDKALELKDPQQMDEAIKRIKMINSVILSMPGIPLLNLIGGDDRAQINDYSYLQEDMKKDDERWVNRLKRNIDFKPMEAAEISVMDRSFTDLVNLTRVRVDEMPAFGNEQIQMVETGKDQVLGFIRHNDQQKAMVLANFSDKPQYVDKHYLLAHDMAGAGIDKIGPEKNQHLQLGNGLELAPYQCMWLVPENMT